LSSSVPGLQLVLANPPKRTRKCCRSIQQHDKRYCDRVIGRVRTRRRQQKKISAQWERGRLDRQNLNNAIVCTTAHRAKAITGPASSTPQTKVAFSVAYWVFRQHLTANPAIMSNDNTAVLTKQRLQDYSTTPPTQDAQLRLTVLHQSQVESGGTGSAPTGAWIMLTVTYDGHDDDRVY